MLLRLTCEQTAVERDCLSIFLDREQVLLMGDTGFPIDDSDSLYNLMRLKSAVISNMKSKQRLSRLYILKKRQPKPEENKIRPRQIVLNQASMLPHQIYDKQVRLSLPRPYPKFCRKCSVILNTATG